MLIHNFAMKMSFPPMCMIEEHYSAITKSIPPMCMIDEHYSAMIKSITLMCMMDEHYSAMIKCITPTLREESCQTNVILQYKLLASIWSAVCSVIQQIYYVLHLYYTLYDGK